MAFLFKSKKNAAEKGHAKDGSGGVAGSQASLNSSGHNRGFNEKQSSSTPSSSVNNSITSLQGGAVVTPSPEQVNGRRGPSSEQASDLPVGCPDLAQMRWGMAMGANMQIVTEWGSASSTVYES